MLKKTISFIKKLFSAVPAALSVLLAIAVFIAICGGIYGLYKIVGIIPLMWMTGILAVLISAVMLLRYASKLANRERTEFMNCVRSDVEPNINMKNVRKAFGIFFTFFSLLSGILMISELLLTVYLLSVVAGIIVLKSVKVCWDDLMMPKHVFWPIYFGELIVFSAAGLAVRLLLFS